MASSHSLFRSQTESRCAQISLPSKLSVSCLGKWLNCPPRVLPKRTGAHPIDHAVTYFNHVCLPRSALLGDIEEVGDKRESFLSAIHRVAIGALLISGVAIPFLKVAAFVADRYSRNRFVTGHNGEPMAIIEFRTQCLPILHAVAQYSVLEPFFFSAATSIRDKNTDPRVRHGIATVFKAVAMNHFNKSIKAMIERCGWHGHFEHGQLLQL